MTDEQEWQFKALTDICTGDANRRDDRLILTGLMGSIRWWFEVLARGMDGKVCDPTSHMRCPDHAVRNPTEQGHHCVVCELFGCTGWARKFRLMVVDNQGGVIQSQIKKGTEFRLRIIPLRPIREEEWCLIDMTLRLIADYGAIGGKTVFKPSDEPNQQVASYHKDYGLLEYISGPWILQTKPTLSKSKLISYVTESRWRNNFKQASFSWASLLNLWCVKGKYLSRQDPSTSSFNKVIGRKEPKKQARDLEQDNDINRWLAGHQKESKKVFSFKHPERGRRTFGFVNTDKKVEFDDIRKRVEDVWSNDKFDFKCGKEILRELFHMQCSDNNGGYR